MTAARRRWPSSTARGPRGRCAERPNTASSTPDAARAFALIRPIEGIWNIAVHNYLLGKQPPAMGLLYWAADQTNMATKFGGQMMQAALENSLTRPGGVIVGGVPIDPSQIT